MADSPILLQKDNTFTKLFVGGLPYHTTDKMLQAYFQKFGEVEEALVIHDRVTNKSKGHGFVTMADRESAERACANPNPVIEGRRANVNLAYLGAKPKNHNSAERMAVDLVYPNADSSLAGMQSPTGGDLFSQLLQSPPPLPFGLQAQGFIVPGPGCPPFSPPPPPMMGPLLYPPYFNPQYGYAPPINPGPMNFPPQPRPPLVLYDATK